MIELLIVIIVIGILAGLVLVGYSRVTAQGRDSRRIADLEAISDAITAYRLRFGDPVTNATCTAPGDGTGNGWFNYVGTGYSKSILSCLTDQGYLNDKYADPTGCGTTTGGNAPGFSCRSTGYAYRKSTCTVGGATVTVLMARLELSGNTANLQGANALCTSASDATTFGMNYMIKVE